MKERLVTSVSEPSPTVHCEVGFCTVCMPLLSAQV
ncbi:MAG: hypothetical protein K0R38_3390 [Polyangiaceae bacterium]|nr:hypothetical protein [Polyangiaceae bacterium]